MKILTVAICAYNMEDYIEEVLDSCIIQEMDKLEVLVMNDGSKDRTAELTQKYCDKYPDTFKLVNKENGGWGSNLNRAVHMAHGKYFKEVDADDWFETENLQKLIGELEKTDADLVLTDHRYCHSDGIRENNAEWAEYAGQLLNMEDLKSFYFCIWDASFLTEKLVKNYLNLPKHTLYTDNLFIMYQLPKLKTAYFIKDVVYNYRLDRDGQSMNVESMRKHYKDVVRVLSKAIDFFNMSEENKKNPHVKGRFYATYIIFFHYFMMMGNDKDVKRALKYIDQKMKYEAPELYEETGKAKRVKLLRQTNYVAYPAVVKIQKWKDDHE